MNSKQQAAWSRFIAPTVLALIAIVAFVAGAWVVGIVASSLALLTLGLRILVIVGLRRAEARQKDAPPIEVTPERIRKRVRAMMWANGIVGATGVVVGVIAVLRLPPDFTLVGWICVAASVLVSGLRIVAVWIARTRALSQIGTAP